VSWRPTVSRTTSSSHQDDGVGVDGKALAGTRGRVVTEQAGGRRLGRLDSVRGQCRQDERGGIALLGVLVANEVPQHSGRRLGHRVGHGPGIGGQHRDLGGLAAEEVHDVEPVTAGQLDSGDTPGPYPIAFGVGPQQHYGANDRYPT